jgi:hypothetical protein
MKTITRAFGAIIVLILAVSAYHVVFSSDSPSPNAQDRDHTVRAEAQYPMTGSRNGAMNITMTKEVNGGPPQTLVNNERYAGFFAKAVFVTKGTNVVVKLFVTLHPGEGRQGAECRMYLDTKQAGKGTATVRPGDEPKQMKCSIAV